MPNPSHKRETSMPPPSPLDIDFTDIDFSSEFTSVIPSDYPGCSEYNWRTYTNEESLDEQLNYTENGMVAAPLGGGGGHDLSANHLQDEQHDYTGNSMVEQQFGGGGGVELPGYRQGVESGDNDGITNTPLLAKKQTRRRSVAKNETAFERIKKERLELHYGETLSETAKSFKVSKSTLKRTCIKHGILCWPLSKKKKKELSTEISNIDEFQSFPTELRTVVAKVKYGDNFIKFEISSASNFAVLQEEITKRLKLKDRSFDIKYVDKDGDSILIKIDADVRMCMKNLDTPIVRMEVLLCSN